MGPTVFTASVCLVSRGEVVMETGAKSISTFPTLEDLIICPAASMDRPIPEFKRGASLPTHPPHPLPGSSVGGEAVISSSVQTGLLIEAVCQVWPWTVVNRTCNKIAFSRGCVCFDSPLYQLHMLLLVQLSGDRDLQLWRRPVHICTKTSEADVSITYRSDLINLLIKLYLFI